MPHYSKLYKVVMDATGADHDAELTFWQGATGQTLQQNPRHQEFHGALLPGQDFALLTQRLDEGPSRVHVDIHTSDLEAEVVRLEHLGATRVRQVHDLWIMHDPAGLPFCVIEDPKVNGDNARGWE